MSDWTAAELDAIDGVDELHIASYRANGTLRPYVTIWSARVGDELYVRAAYGPGTGWFRHATASGTGRIRAGGIERDVTFTPAGASAGDPVDAAYRAKYARYGRGIAEGMLGPAMHGLTLRVDPVGSP
jgi:hypothetical protein